jgi:hypothetical protein
MPPHKILKDTEMAMLEEERESDKNNESSFESMDDEDELRANALNSSKNGSKDQTASSASNTKKKRGRRGAKTVKLDKPKLYATRQSNLTRSKAKSSVQKRPLSTPEDHQKLNKKPKSQASRMEVDNESSELIADEDDKPANVREAIMSKKMAIVTENYPDSCFVMDDLVKIEQHITVAMKDADEAEEIPCFQYRRLERGYIKLACVGSVGLTWLTKVIEKWNSNGKTAKLIEMRNLPLEPVFKVWITGEFSEFEDVLSLMRKQNKQLSTSDWRLRGIKRQDNGTLYFIGLDPVTLEIIKNRNYLIFYGLTQVKFTLIKNNDGSKEASTEITNETGTHGSDLRGEPNSSNKH